MRSSNYVLLLALLVLSACGGGSGGGSSSSQPERQEEGQEFAKVTPGTYYTVLRPVNFRSNGFIPYGMATFKVTDEQIQISSSLDDDQAVAHRQNLHEGTRCPTMADDTNGDGFVDYDEAQRVVGPVMMELKTSLNIIPRGPAMTYNRTTAVSSLKGMGVGQRVVLVHGTSAQSDFPTSLASFEGEPAHLSLPIVCGVLEKID